MKPVNLYTLTSVSDPHRFSSFESVLSVRESIQNFKEHEINRVTTKRSSYTVLSTMAKSATLSSSALLTMCTILRMTASSS